MLIQSGIYSLAPGWSSVFDKWDGLHRFQKEAVVTDLGYLNKNPIAEAYSWNCSYFDRESPEYCAECSWFAWSYSYVVTGDLSLDREIVELKGGQFVDHWNSRHNGVDENIIATPVDHISGVHSGSVSSFSRKKVHRVKVQ